jgi:hypothetical protein
LEWVTLGWNVAGIIVLAIAVVAVRSVALAGFGLDSLIEIGASTVAIWELSGSGEERQLAAARARPDRRPTQPRIYWRHLSPRPASWSSHRPTRRR